MRVFLGLLSLSVFLFAQERYCIEALSVEKKSDITKEFMQKIEELSMPYTQKQIEGKHKVLIGDYETRKEAEALLAKVQEKVNKDAFVSVSVAEEKPASLSAASKMRQAMLMAQAKMISKPTGKEDEVPNAKEPKTEVIDVTGPQEKLNITRTDKKTGKVIKRKKKKDATKVLPKLVCKTTKKALREEEISQALGFYKSSSFYTFRD